MRFGVCMPIEQAEFIAKLGFDYLEVSAAGLAEMTEAQFADFRQKKKPHPSTRRRQTVCFRAVLS